MTIAVDGVITLRGDVSSYREKHAERVALHVFGVKAVANDLNLRLIANTSGRIANSRKPA